MSIYDIDGNSLLNSVYKGKSLSILGDSISTFAGYIPSGNANFYTGSNCGVSSVNDTWWMKLMTALGMTLNLNNSWSGARATTTNGETSAGVTRASNLGTSPDVIIVYMGINDFNNEVGIGTYDGTGTFPTSATTFREAYAMMLNTILTAHKTAEVWVCTLPYDERNGSADFPEANGNDVLLTAWNQAIRDIADLFGVRVIEFAKCGLTYQNMDTYMGDWSSGTGQALHPNADGHTLMANMAIKTLDSSNDYRF